MVWAENHKVLLCASVNRSGKRYYQTIYLIPRGHQFIMKTYTLALQSKAIYYSPLVYNKNNTYTVKVGFINFKNKKKVLNLKSSWHIKYLIELIDFHYSYIIYIYSVISKETREYVTLFSITNSWYSSYTPYCYTFKICTLNIQEFLCK